MEKLYSILEIFYFCISNHPMSFKIFDVMISISISNSMVSSAINDKFD